MQIITKTFQELSTEELFDIYQLRVAVFVVEQNCPYQEVDEKDKLSIHMMLKEDERILAYLRVLPPGVSFPEASIGRVIAVERRKGYASILVKEAIRTALQTYHVDTLTIEAQTYAREFYEKLGFYQTSEEFLEDGIPHIQMQYKKD